MKKKQLSVRLHGKPIGVLEQLPTGKMVFVYNTSAKEPISYSMPITDKAYQHAHCEAYFGGLLPESDTVKKIIARQYGISANNIFFLLKAIGHDCAGAISFYEMDAPIVAKHSVKLDGKIINENSFYDHIKALPQKPLFLGFDDLRLSLAGVQDKAAVCVIDNKILLPQHDCPTTHILKPENPAFEHLCENEFICMHLANTIGLMVAPVDLKHVKDIAYLLIKRFDRIISNNTIIRIHQEDFCQALAVNSTKKYQNEGGPGLQNCFDLLMNTTQPVIARNHLASAIVYNFLIGNCDAHGKNFSLLHHNSENITLSPLYDLVSTIFYSALSTKMAMKIGDEYKIERINLSQWEKLCHLVQYNFPRMKKLIVQQCNDIMAALEKNKEFYIEATKKPNFVMEFSKKMITRISRISTSPL